ncbi:hypothetical protein [Thiorhodovibrio litoralis]|uniref:hypothetical protein n=1 Tax=Thiorhodovibrio litoralis TaxID=2952932 RepID=UPI002B259905|nr:hypothetical protein [Thiorhodovibrio litoralis]
MAQITEICSWMLHACLWSPKNQRRTPSLSEIISTKPNVTAAQYVNGALAGLGFAMTKLNPKACLPAATGAAAGAPIADLVHESKKIR